MPEEHNYIGLSSVNDFNNGYNYNLFIRDGYMTVADLKKRKGILRLKALDSGSNGNAWHRAVIKADIPPGAFIKLWFYASDRREIVRGEESFNLDDYSGDEEAEAKWREIFQESKPVNSRDILLHAHKGRFLWLGLELNAAEEAPVITGMRIYYPAHSFIRYLPEIFQEKAPHNSFFERFTAIFQSMYLDLEARIDALPVQLDPKSADEAYLLSLVKWMKLEEFQAMPKAKLRSFLQLVSSFAGRIGTKEFLTQAIELIWEEKFFIVEHFQLKKYSQVKNKQLLKQIYGDQIFSFTVLLIPVPDAEEKLEWLNRLITRFKPAYSTYRLIVLEDGVILDHPTYLGVNSVIKPFKQPFLDGKTEVGQIILR